MPSALTRSRVRCHGRSRGRGAGVDGGSSRGPGRSRSGRQVIDGSSWGTTQAFHGRFMVVRDGGLLPGGRDQARGGPERDRRKERRARSHFRLKRSEALPPPGEGPRERALGRPCTCISPQEAGRLSLDDQREVVRRVLRRTLKINYTAWGRAAATASEAEAEAGAVAVAATTESEAKAASESVIRRSGPRPATGHRPAKPM